ncbi:MAG: type IV secretion system DNA-binding domain-containing protein [Patescibacteria group bacterium]
MDDLVTIFALTTFRNQMRKFGIKVDDRRRHMYLIGKTGMGKSTVQENMIIEDIRAGRGVAVVDPHGDLAEKVIEYIPTERVNDVIYFNPADMEYPIAFNVVEQVEPHLRHLVASGLIGVFKKLWADSWGPRLEYILRNSILAILDYPGSTLLAVTRMLSDKPFRKRVISKIQDPVVKAFWVNEFAGYADKFASEAVSPIQNKVGQFLSSSLIRNIVGQVKSSIDMRQIMDEGKILIMNLSKGRIGEDNSSLLGSMMITKIQLAAMSRVDVPENERRDFYLYIDEFQNFTTDSFANILSEARKYRLNLIMANQYIEQLGEIVRPAVFGNVGTLLVFRVGATDAEELVKEFTPTFTEEDIVNLPKYELYLKLMIDGIASDPFSARGLPPLSEEEKTGNIEKVVKVSRERYAKKKEVVEDKIIRWHTNIDEDISTKDKVSTNKIVKQTVRSDNNINNNKVLPAKDRDSKFNQNKTIKKNFSNLKIEEKKIREGRESQARPIDSGVYKFETVCSRCNKETQTSFKPDGVRPVFCKECLSILRQERREEIERRKKAKVEELGKLRIDNPPFNTTNRPDKQGNKEEIDINKEGLSLNKALKMEPIDFKQNKDPGSKIIKESNKIENKVDSTQTQDEQEFHEGDEVAL